jgi:hypothetical protein
VSPCAHVPLRCRMRVAEQHVNLKHRHVQIASPLTAEHPAMFDRGTFRLLFAARGGPVAMRCSPHQWYATSQSHGQLLLLPSRILRKACCTQYTHLLLLAGGAAALSLAPTAAAAAAPQWPPAACAAQARLHTWRPPSRPHSWVQPQARGMGHTWSGKQGQLGSKRDVWCCSGGGSSLRLLCRGPLCWPPSVCSCKRIRVALATQLQHS